MPFADLPALATHFREALQIKKLILLYAYKPAVDAWAKYDNVGESPVLLEWGENP